MKILDILKEEYLYFSRRERARFCLLRALAIVAGAPARVIKEKGDIEV